MTSALFPVRSSVLSAEALAERVLPCYPLPAPRHCRLISRSMNDTYAVSAEAETSYLRVSGHGWRTGEEIAAELAFITALVEQGLPVAPVIRREDDGLITEVAAPEGTRYVVLFARAPGESARDISTQQAHAYGQLAAALHTAADAGAVRLARFNLDERHLLDEPMAAVRAAIADGSEDLDFLERVVERVRGRTAAMPRTAPGFGMCHGDLHPGNIRIDVDDRITLFDFDCMGYGWRSYDLMVFLWNAYGERRPKRWRESRWRAFLRGYLEVHPLPEDLEEAVPLFLVARQVWLMGLDCADRSGWPPQWIDQQWLQGAVRQVRNWQEEFPVLVG